MGKLAQQLGFVEKHFSGHPYPKLKRELLKAQKLVDNGVKGKRPRY